MCTHVCHHRHSAHIYDVQQSVPLIALEQRYMSWYSTWFLFAVCFIVSPLLFRSSFRKRKFDQKWLSASNLNSTAVSRIHSSKVILTLLSNCCSTDRQLQRMKCSVPRKEGAARLLLCMEAAQHSVCCNVTLHLAVFCFMRGLCVDYTFFTCSNQFTNANAPLKGLVYQYKLHTPNWHIQIFLFLTMIFPELGGSVMYT